MHYFWDSCSKFLKTWIKYYIDHFKQKNIFSRILIIMHSAVINKNILIAAGIVEINIIIKTHVRGFFDTDLHEVSWHFATHEAVKFNWPSEDQCQRSHSKWVFVFIPHLKSKYNQLIVSKLSRKALICPRRSPWRLIVLVRSLRSARLHTAWLVKSMTYFNLIG